VSEIAVVGSANMDLVVRQARLPRPGETMFGSDFSTVPGGKGLNQAVAAARAGGSVAFVGAAVRTVDVATGTAHISVVDGGENSIVVVSGANAAVDGLDDTDRAVIAAARYVVAQFERPLPLVRAAFVAAREAGAVTVLTPAPVLDAGDLLELTDILVPNAGEACELAGVDDPTEAALALSRRAGTVVMTRGPEGALIARGGEILAEVPSRRVEAVDTTAAGDTFVGTLVTRLAAGDGLEDAARTAAVAASLSVTRAGATTSMPTWDEIAAALST
jgi:ribokinase